MSGPQSRRNGAIVMTSSRGPSTQQGIHQKGCSGWNRAGHSSRGKQHPQEKPGGRIVEGVTHHRHTGVSAGGSGGLDSSGWDRLFWTLPWRQQEHLQRPLCTGPPVTGMQDKAENIDSFPTPPRQNCMARMARGPPCHHAHSQMGSQTQEW